MVGIFGAVMALNWAMHGCVSDRFGRCIEWWMIADYPVRTALVAALGAAMGVWMHRDD